MRYIIILLLFFMHANTGAQVVTFNKMFPDTVPSMRNIVVSDTGYVILGGGGSPLYILTAFADLQGNITTLKKIRNNNMHIYHGYENSLIKTSDGGYALPSCMFNVNNNIKQTNFIKLNNQFDTIFTKSYLIDTIYVSALACMQSGNNYYLTGEQGISSTNSDVLLIKTDSLGNMLWNKKIGGSRIDYGTKIVPTYDGNLLIGGYSTSYSQSGNWLLLKTDTAGTQLWLNPWLGHPDENDGWVRGLINTSDSCYIATGNFAVGNWDLRVSVVKMDENLNVIYNKLYLKKSGYTSANSIIELQNKNYLLAGIEILTGSTILGFLMELSSDGNIIWKRNFNATGNINSRSRAYAVAPTPDNGFAFTGHVYDTQITPAQQIWLVKTDSLGCDGVHSCDDTTMFVAPLNLPDSVCFGDSVHITFGFGGRSAPYTLHSTSGFLEDSIYYFDSGNDTITRTVSFLPTEANTYYSFAVTLTDPWGATKTGQYSFYVKNCSTSVALYHNDLLRYQVYPNPANESITISCSENEQTTVYLLNIQGETLYQSQLQNNKTIIDLRGFESGIYIIKLIDDNGFVIKKVVKE